MLNLLVSCNNTPALLAAEQISFTVGCGWLGHGLDILLAANIDSDFHNRKITENIFRRNTEFRPVLRISRGWRLLRESSSPWWKFPARADKSPSNFFITSTPPPTKYRQLTRQKTGRIIQICHKIFIYLTLYPEGAGVVDGDPGVPRHVRDGLHILHPAHSGRRRP